MVLVLALAVLARGLRAEGRTPAVLLFGMVMLGIAAVPRDLFDNTLSVAGVLAAATAGALLLTAFVDAMVAVAVIIGVVTTLFLAWWLYALLLVMAVVGALIGLGYAIVRVRRARLGRVAGPQGARGKVLMGGKVVGPEVAPPPGLEHRDDLVWWAAVLPENDKAFVSGDLMLQREHSAIIVRGAALTFDFRIANTEFPHYTDLAALYVGLGMDEDEARREVSRQYELAKPPVPEDQRNADQTYRVYCVREGTEVSVIGTPEWERGPKSGVYRDAPVVPVFHDNHLAPPHLLDRPLVQARREAWYDAVAWAVTGSACAAALAYLSHAGVL